MGDSPVLSPKQSDWPQSLWVCPIPNDVMALEREEERGAGVLVTVKYESQEVKLSIHQGKYGHKPL